MSIRIVVLLWLALCAVFDLKRREVPDRLTLPLLAGMLVWRVIHLVGWLPWALAAAAVVLTLADLPPGGDMKGLAVWLGAGVVYMFWRVVRRERRMPGYVGFLLGAAGWLWG